MPPKMVSISARITHEDAEFISQMEIEGAKTPSDKLRAIITDARQRSLRKQDYAGSLQLVQSMIHPVVERIRQSELEKQMHSEIITRAAEWMPDTVALLASFIPNSRKPIQDNDLHRLEQGLVDRLVRLTESMLQLALTTRCPCYDQDVIKDRIKPVLDLCGIIMAQLPNPKGE